MNLGKCKILKNNITACDEKFILAEIQKKIQESNTLLVSPIASYTLTLAYNNKNLEAVLEKFTYLLPDSQWIRWSLNFLYGKKLNNSVSGTKLMLKICDISGKKGYKIFLYGTTKDTLACLKKKLMNLSPRLNIVGMNPSKFRKITQTEKYHLLRKIEKSGANIMFVALGSPLQEIFTVNLLYEKPKLDIPIVVIPVGAAFDFISGVKPQAPEWLQKIGLEWLFRFINEPKRLWKRYLLFGPFYLILIFQQKVSILVNNLSEIK